MFLYSYFTFFSVHVYRQILLGFLKAKKKKIIKTNKVQSLDIMNVGGMGWNAVEIKIS